jgi:hypothetical protein
MIISQTDKEFSFTFPKFKKRFNPYDEDGDYGEYPNLTGLIIRQNGNKEIGFAHTIDMSYAGKPDQVTDIVIHYDRSEESFRKDCAKMGLNIVEMSL